MISINALLNSAAQAGVFLYLEDGKLKYSVKKGNFPQELKTAIIANKAQIVEALAKMQEQKQFIKDKIPPIEIIDSHDNIPLSFSQQRLWFIDELQGASPEYNIPSAFSLRGQLKIAAFEQAVHCIIERHMVLRTVIKLIDGQVEQQVRTQFDLPVNNVDLTDLSGQALQDRVRTLVQADAQKPFDLANDLLLRVQLLKLTDDEHVVLFNMHHIASDGWSMGVLVREFTSFYTTLSQGLPSPLPPLSVQYADYAHWQRNWLQGEVLDKHLDYWREQLVQLPKVHSLPLDHPRPAEQTFDGASYFQTLQNPLCQSMQNLCQRQDVTLFMLLQSAFSILIGRYSGETDVVLGTPIAGRVHQNVEGLIGFFVNTLILRSDLSANPSFASYLEQTKQTILAAYTHQNIPFEMLVETLRPERSLAYSPVVQVCLNLQKNEELKLSLPGLELEGLAKGKENAPYEIELNIVEREDSLLLNWKYNTALFEGETIERMASNFEVLLQSITADQSVAVQDLSMISAAQRQQVLIDWNQTSAPQPKGHILHTMFEHQVEVTPGAVAVVCDGNKTTYQQLNERSNQVAHYLLQRGIKPDTLVGIAVARNVDMLIGVMAILKAGAAYCPLDPAYPKARITHMLEDSGVELVLTQSAVVEHLPQSSAELVRLDSDWPALIAAQSTDNPNISVNPQQLAYVIYTSGSTGLPKGVLIEHQNAAAMVNWSRNAFSDEELRSVLFSTSFCFDLSVFEIFATLANGGQLVVVDNILELQSEQNVEPVSLINTVPSAIRALIESNTSMQGVLTVNVAGEYFHQDTVDALYQAGVRQVNDLYGPSEDTTYTTWATRKPGGVNSIGNAVDNTRLYVLDGRMEPVAIGVAAELYIAGDGVSRGYNNQPQLTAQRYLDCLIGGQIKERVYQSGDIVRWLPDGQLEYVSRADTQVKVRGFRVEPGEIENCLMAIDEIKHAVVLCREDNGHDKRLVAYLALEKPLEADSEAALAELKHQRISRYSELLKADLPDYMVPGIMMFLDAIPLTANGKVDKKKLPAPDETHLRTQPYVAPRDETEAILCDIWQQLLGLEQVGIEDNFFALGGDSIVSIQVASRAKLQGLHVSVKQLFEHQHIGALSPHITKAQQITAQQTPSEGSLPLLPIQRQFFTKAMAKPNHYNQSVLLKTPPGFNLDNLKVIVAALYQRHDALRLRFIDGQASYATYDEGMLEQTLSSHALGQLSAQLKEQGEQLQSSLDIGQGPLFKAAYFDGADGQGRLLLAIHHLAVDGVSWRIILSDLALAWTQLSRQQPVHLAVKTSSYQQWAQALLEYSESDALRAERDYWLAQLAIPTKPLPALEVGVQPQMPSERHRIGLNEQQTKALLGECNLTYRTGVNELLLSALMVAYRAWTGESTLRVELEGHGREELFATLDINETVGWFTSLYPLVLQTGPQADMAAVIKAVKEQNRALPNRGIGFGLLQEVAGDEDINRLNGSVDGSGSQSSIIFNYLGQFDASVSEDGAFAAAQEFAGHSVSPDNETAALLNLDGMVHDNRLTFNLVGAQGRFEDVQLKTFANAFEQALVACVEHCQSSAGAYTPSDFPNSVMDMPKLDVLQSSHPSLENLYIATPMQAGLLFHGLLDDSGASYTTIIHCDLVGEIDMAVFKQAWQSIIARHEVFRTSFVGLEEKQIHQLVHNDVTLPFIELDWREQAQTLAQTADALAAYRRQDKANGFDFLQPPLMRISLIRLSDERYHFVWTHHHVLSDGWCLPVVFGEVLTSYRALLNGSTPVLPQVVPYEQYIAWLCAQDKSQARDFWSDYLDGFSAPTPLNIDKLPPEPGQQGPQSQSWQLSDALRAQLSDLAKACRCTMSVIMQTAWSLLLRGYSAQDEVVFGATVSGRPAHLPGVEKMIGLFINTLPVRVTFDDQQTLGEVLQALHQQNVASDEYSYLGLGEILGLSELPTGVALFDSLIVYENYPTEIGASDSKAATGIDVQDVGTGDQTNFGLLLNVHDNDQIKLQVSYRLEKFADQTISRLLTHLEHILTAMASGGEQLAIGGIELLSVAEKQTQLLQWNDVATDYPTGLCIHQLLERQAQLHPDNVAVICASKELTYAQLNSRSNRLAHYLIAQGVKPDTLIGLSVERSLDVMVGLFGILKAGGAYVPLDPGYPKARLEHMLADSSAGIILTQQSVLDSLPVTDQQVLCLDDDNWRGTLDNYPDSNPQVTSLTPNNLAYVIYTSGSTGQPKGVLVEHHSVVNFLQYSAEVFLPEHIVGSLVSAPLAFDGTVCTLYTPFLEGKYVELLAAEDTAIDLLADYIFDDEEPLLFKLTPAHLEALLSIGGQSANADAEHVFVIAGELLVEKTLAIWRDELLPNSTFFNEYGPTEATVGTTVYHSKTGHQHVSASGSVPIGGPLANARLYVLGPDLALLPVGVPGELYIGGAGLARGYLNQPQMTDERFIDNPHSGIVDDKMYKTGDLVRWLPDGNIEFINRIDHQVKLRGFRIELGEINNQLSKVEGVKESVVLCRDDEGHEKRLVGYVIPQSPLAAEGIEDDAQLLELKRQRSNEYITALKSHLPDYMVPGIFVFMTEFPLTPNGKVNRQGLPAPEEADLPKQAYVAPSNETERILCEIWQEVLGIKEIGIEDNFFALGGDSIVSIQAASRAKQQGLQLSVKQLFDFQTVSALAPFVGHTVKVDAPQGPSKGVAPLLPIQQLFFNRDLPQPNHYNHSVLLQTPEGFSAGALEAMVVALYQRHDVLRLRFAQASGQWQGQFDDYHPSMVTGTVAAHDLSALDDTGRTETLGRISDEVQRSLDFVNGPIFKAVFFDYGQQPGRVLLVLHHLVVDGVSWRILLADLGLAWAQLGRGDDIKLLPKTSSIAQWGEALQGYANSPQLLAERDYWLAQQAVALEPLPALFDDNGSGSGDCSPSYRIELDQEQTAMALGECNTAYRTQVNELLLSSLMVAYQQWTGHSNLRVEMEGHGREELFDTLDTNETIGWFTSIYPLVLQTDSDAQAQIESVIKAVKEQHRSLPKRGIGYGILKYLGQNPQLAHSGQDLCGIAFNYLGQFDASVNEEAAFGAAKENAGRAVSELNQRATLLSLDGMVHEGKLVFNLMARENHFADSAMVSLAAYIEQGLKDCVDHCLLMNMLKMRDAQPDDSQIETDDDDDAGELLI
jgi:amino acid adenylation domain-containing protein/non-ribosomal peptide synthase protein (TIGR01720 family)